DRRRGAVLSRLTRLDAALLFVLGLAVRLPLLLGAVTLHGGDAMARLARSDHLLLAYQLPLAQSLVFAARAIDPEPRVACVVFVVLGALVPVALAAVVAETAGRAAGCASGALLACHALFVHYAIVPYQEGLMIALVLGGAWALLRRHEIAASVLLGLACLTRYEAWLAALLAVLAASGWRWRRLPRALALFGWAPLLWVALWRGLSPAGTYVFDLDPVALRLTRVWFVLGKLREYSGGLLLALGLLGLAVAAFRWDKRWGWAAAYLALFLPVIMFGHEFPPGSGRVSERLAHVPAAALCALAGLGLGWLVERAPRAATAALAAALTVAAALHGVRHARMLITEAGRDPSLLLAAQTAAFAHAHLPRGGHLAVAAPTVSPADLQSFVHKVEAAGGDVGRARAVAAELTRHSPDVDRIAAHLARPPGTVVGADTAPAELVAVYDDAPDAAAWQRGLARARFTAGPRAVTVYERP
ncbi:MAG TPA: hypothetical protein VF310_17095, partial [Vicinamibacteria bacterium]